MNIEVKLFASFREGRFAIAGRRIAPGTTVSEIIADLDIPLEDVGITMLNGRHCTFETEVKENDILGIFPRIGGG